MAPNNHSELNESGVAIATERPSSSSSQGYGQTAAPGRGRVDGAILGLSDVPFVTVKNFRGLEGS